MNEFLLSIATALPGCALSYWMGYRQAKSDMRHNFKAPVGRAYVYWTDSDGMRHYAPSADAFESSDD